MRVLHVVRQFAPAIGGLENYVGELARVQADRGHEVTVLTLDRMFTKPDHVLPDFERIGAVAVKRIAYSGSHKYPIAPKVLGHLRQCDLVHVQGIDFFFDALAWTRLWHGRPLVVSTHGGFFHTPFAARLKKAFFHTVTRASLRGYSAVLASSVGDSERFAAIARQPIDLVENGVDIEKFANCASPAFRKRMIAIGRFASHKRLDRLLDFLFDVRSRDPQWTLTIAGPESDVTAKELRLWIEARGLGESVTVKVGLSDAGIAAEIGRASVVVSASEYEGFGISVVEGMSAGLFPVMNDIAPFRRLSEQSRMGLLVDFSDTRASAARFLEETDEIARNYGRLRLQAQKAAERFAWPDVARRIETIYERVIGERKRNILGVPVLVSTRDEAVRTLDAEVDAGHMARVSFLNAHGANIAHGHEKFSEALRDSVVLNDGVGVDIASLWRYGRRFPENLNGTDFTVEYLKRTRHDYGIYLLGARRRVVTQAAIKLAARFRRHRILGYNDGYFAPSETQRIVSDIRRSGANLLLVGFGNPAQELWIAENLEKTGCKLAFGVGALFDFVSGSVPRAPEWIRRCRAEWLFRLTQEPGRLWRRYVIGNLAFLYRLLNQGLGDAPFARTGR